MLSKGVGMKTDVRSSVDSVFGGSDESRCPGSSDESPGDWHSYPSRMQEAKDGPTHRKVPKFRTGRLAFNGQDESLLPTLIYLLPSAGRFLQRPERLCECSGW